MRPTVPMKTLDLSSAASHIKQACDDSGLSSKSPFFFLVGAGISHPSIPLARDIEKECKSLAAKYKRLDEPRGTNAIDTYSHWMGTAFPQPVQRQRYLRRLIEKKPISHANLRLAHLLLKKTLTNLIVTTNFDDLLSRALTLFGEQHIICDHPSTVERIDPEQNDLQLIHVHGTYWFYDCCNLHGELQARAKASANSTLTMASLLDNVLYHRSPLVIGYSGWEGDVFMSALKRRLQTRLPLNLYWFCHRGGALDNLPDWLTNHEDVFFVLPTCKNGVVVKEDGAKSRDPLPTEESALAGPLKEIGEKDGDEPTLTAQQILDELIQSFALEAPQLTLDPLNFFAKQLRSSLPHTNIPQPQTDLYFIDSVVMRIERAMQREIQSSQVVESHLEAVRDALRRSQYREGIENAKKIRLEDLSDAQLRELIDAASTAALGLGDRSVEEIHAYELEIAAIETLLERRPYDSPLEAQLVSILMTKGLTQGFNDDHEDAVRTYEDVVSRFSKRQEIPICVQVAAALTYRAGELRELTRFEE